MAKTEANSATDFVIETCTGPCPVEADGTLLQGKLKFYLRGRGDHVKFIIDEVDNDPTAWYTTPEASPRSQHFWVCEWDAFNYPDASYIDRERVQELVQEAVGKFIAQRIGERTPSHAQIRLRSSLPDRGLNRPDGSNG